MTLELFITSALLGVGLAMDAFSVSIADGLTEQNMRKRKMLLIAGTFAAFQFMMPLAGWVFVRGLEGIFTSFQILIPWIALILLLYVGGKMLLEGIAARREKAAAAVDAADSLADPSQDASQVAESGAVTGMTTSAATGAALTFGALILQGIATSIDALSVGFAIAEYTSFTAFISALIIGIVTLAICIAGLALGRQIGSRLSGKAEILGGVILIAIGIEVWARGVFL